jgi:hypothetical protein
MIMVNSTIFERREFCLKYGQKKAVSYVEEADM